jgi:hypothetical protein
MVKLTGLPPKMRAPALRRAAYVRDQRGILILAKWPTGKKTKISQRQQERIDWFIEAQFAAKNTVASQQRIAREAVAGTPLLPRDILTAAFAGRLFAYAVEAHGIMYSVAMANDVSQNLDIIGQVPGDILWRDTDRWNRLPKGSAGQVLIIDATTGFPVWQTPSGGGSGKVFAPMPGNSGDAFGAATKGWSFTPLVNITITDLIINYDEISTGTYIASVVQIVAGSISAVLAQSGTINGAVNAQVQKLFALTAPAALVAGNLYALLHTRTDSATTTNAGTRDGVQNGPPVPCDLAMSRVTLASLNPAVAETPTFTPSLVSFTVQPIYSIA